MAAFKPLLPISQLANMSKHNDPNWHLVYENFDPKLVKYVA
jgi:hypothetical protein